MTAGVRRWIGAAVLAGVAGFLPCRASRGQAPPEPVSQEIADVARADLQRLAAQLNDPNAPQEARDEAARRLVSRQTPEARRLVTEALTNLNVGGQLAAARALADDPDPDPSAIDPLFETLGTNRALTEAAARALAAYKTNDEIVARLTEYAQRRQASEASRLGIIRAIGSLPHRRAAEFLVSVLRNGQESVAARNAAADALAEMTGLPDGGADVERWSQWWQQNAQKSEEQFRADLLVARFAREDRRDRRHQGAAAALATFLREQYRTAGADARPELLVRYLRTEQPEVRAVAAGIILDEALEGNKDPSAGVREQLRTMIGDSDESVRGAVAEVFAKINDAPALEALLAQLAQETHPNVRASLAGAVAPINDLRAVPVLVSMLGDRSLPAAAAAAKALKALGQQMREKDPAMARRAAVALREALDRRTTPTEFTALREALIDAMVPLRQEDLLPVFTRMLDERRGETVEVRRLAVRGIGEIAKPETAGLLVDRLTDRSERIRLAAVQALAANPALSENAWALRDTLDPQKEPVEEIRNTAWRALESVFPLLSKQQLNVWADWFKNDAPRKLIVLEALAAQQLRDREEDDLATTRTNIGEMQMEQKDYRRAAESFRLALEYRKQRGVQLAALENLMIDRMKALLLAKDYPAAADFARQMIAENQQNVPTMGGLIWNEAQRLRDAGDLQAALDLIAATKNIQLSTRHQEQLATIEKEINGLKSQQNGAEPPPGPRSASGQ